MPEAWTGGLIGQMHNAGITKKELAEEMSCTKAYVSMILSGARKPPNARERLEAAFEAVNRRKNGENGGGASRLRCGGAGDE